LINLNDHQKEFLEHYNKHSSIGVPIWNRGSGKTFLLIYDICTKVLSKPNQKIGMFVVGSFLPFLSDRFFDMFEALGKTNYIKSHNTKMIKLVNNSEIFLYSNKTSFPFRGEVPNYNFLYIDDVEYMSPLSLINVIQIMKQNNIPGLFTCSDFTKPTPSILNKHLNID